MSPPTLKWISKFQANVSPINVVADQDGFTITYRGGSEHWAAAKSIEEAKAKALGSAANFVDWFECERYAEDGNYCLSVELRGGGLRWRLFYFANMLQAGDPVDFAAGQQAVEQAYHTHLDELGDSAPIQSPSTEGKARP